MVSSYSTMSRRSRAPICRNQRLRGVLDAATTPLNELSEVIQKEPRTPVGQGRLLLEWQEALDICEEEEAADGAPPRPEETASGRVVAAELAAMLEERLAEDASRWAREAPRGRGSCQSDAAPRWGVALGAPIQQIPSFPHGGGIDVGLRQIAPPRQRVDFMGVNSIQPTVPESLGEMTACAEPGSSAASAKPFGRRCRSYGRRTEWNRWQSSAQLCGIPPVLRATSMSWFVSKGSPQGCLHLYVWSGASQRSLDAP